MGECIEGGGCLPPEPECPVVESGFVQTREPDTGLVVYGPSGVGLGGSCSCDAGLGGWTLLPWIVVFLLLRRGSRALAVLLLLVVGAEARAQDVRTWVQLDGGPLPGFVEPQTPAEGPDAWSFRSAVSVMRTTDPVVLRTNRGTRDLVRSLDSVEAGMSLRIADLFRLGVALPLVRSALVTETTVRLGAPALFLIREASDHSVLQIVVETRQRRPPPFAGQPSFAFGFTGRRPLGRFDGLWRVQFEGRWPVQEVGGVVWGHRFEGALGLRTRGRVAGGAQLVASAPAQLFGVRARGAWPVEAVGSLHVRANPWLVLDGWVGAGLTRGLGASRGRVGLGVRTANTPKDRDRDGIADLVDRCDDDPEDRDRWRDRDGCPDPDNDADGLLDPDDACPDDPETVNGHLDGDGCPDELARLTITARSEVGFERVYIAVDEVGGWQISGRRTVEVVPGRRQVRVLADEHHELVRFFDVPEAGREVELRLRPIRMGSCGVRVEASGGAGLAARWSSDAGEVAIPVEGRRIERPVGNHEGVLQAEGYLDQWVVLGVVEGDCDVVWTMAPGQPAPPIGFETDSAALVDDSEAALDALAAWLRAHPEVRLVRVTGSADDVGTPAYNYELSLARARAVIEALVRREVERSRLLASGDGEGRAEIEVTSRGPASNVSIEATGAPLREVRFSILVWDEGRLSPSADQSSKGASARQASQVRP